MGGYSKHDVIRYRGKVATVKEFRSLEDNDIIVIEFATGERRSYMLDEFKAEIIVSGARKR